MAKTMEVTTLFLQLCDLDSQEPSEIVIPARVPGDLEGHFERSLTQSLRTENPKSYTLNLTLNAKPH